MLRNRVKRTGGFIKYQHLSVRCKRPRRQYLLILPSRHNHAIISKFFRQDRINALFQLLHSILDTCQPQCFVNDLFISRRISLHRYIVSDRSGKYPAILKGTGVQLTIRSQIILSDINIIDENHSLRGIVESQKQLHQSRFACAVKSYQCTGFPTIDLETDILQYHPGILVAKAYISELNAANLSIRHDSIPVLRQFRFKFQKFLQIGNEKGIFIITDQCLCKIYQYTRYRDHQAAQYGKLCHCQAFCHQCAIDSIEQYPFKDRSIRQEQIRPAI